MKPHKPSKITTAVMSGSKAIQHVSTLYKQKKKKCIVDEWMHLPWLTYSEELLVPPILLCVSRVWFEVLIDDMLLWDGKALLSISPELGLQKSSVKLCLFIRWPWILSPFDGSSTEITSGGLVQHPRQPLLCNKLGLSPDKWLVYQWKLLRYKISHWRGFQNT